MNTTTTSNLTPEIKAGIIQAIATQFGIPTDHILDTQQMSDLGADSLDLVEIVMGAEDELCKQVRDFDVDPTITVAAFCEKFADNLTDHPL